VSDTFLFAVHVAHGEIRSKAVANGALSWYLQNPVSARMSKYYYGVEVNAAYDPTVEDAESRPTYRNRRGDLRVESAWDCIVAKVCFSSLRTIACSLTWAHRMSLCAQDKTFIKLIAWHGVKTK
jgi:hypothetical protein